ncbi:MAG: universal stress protein [Thermodesulfovibrionales bacterium]
MEIKKILCPTDFLEGSRSAVQYAVDLAKKYEATLYLLHVMHDLEKATGWYIPHVTVDELYKDIEAGAEKQIEKLFAEELRGFKAVEHRIVKGIPADEIIKFGEEIGADIIVMGTHGRKGIDRIIFGSTAERVVKSSKIPVLTVRV